jgi:hypothetical protein
MQHDVLMHVDAPIDAPSLARAANVTKTNRDSP